jgi:hypothetical protein
LKHYSTKAPIDLQKAADHATKTTYKDLNEKRTALNVDLKSVLFPKNKSLNIFIILSLLRLLINSFVSDKKKEKDSKSAELGQVDNIASSSVTVNTSSETNIKSINIIDQVGK